MTTATAKANRRDAEDAENGAGDGRRTAMARNELDGLREQLAARARQIGARPVKCEAYSAKSLGAAQ